MKKLIIATTLCATTAAMSATTVNHYGFVQAGYVMADKVVTGSEHKAFYAQDENASPSDFDEEQKTMMTSANSRWGMTASNGSKTSGKLEFDLNGNQASGVSSATTTKNGQIRVRQANMSYKMSENATITMGKKWTKFMGVNPYTMAATRVSFWAGNNGFIVDGIDYTRTMGDTTFSLELSNSGDATDNDVSGTVKTIDLNHKMGSHKFGLAHTMGTIAYSVETDTEDDAAASGTKLYWAGQFGATSANFQYTMGSNLALIHTGALASGTTDGEEYKETGILLSAKHAFGNHAVMFSHGISELADEEEAGNAGVAKNTLTSVGFTTNLDAGLIGYIEHQMFTTGRYSTTEEATEDSTGTTTEFGMKYTF